MTLIRTLVLVAVLAMPLAGQAGTLDLSSAVKSVSNIVETVNNLSSTFEAGRGWWSWPPRRPGNNGVPNPGPKVPEPTAALLFGIGAVAVGIGVRRRR